MNHVIHRKDNGRGNAVSRIGLLYTCVCPDISLDVQQCRTGHLLSVAESSENTLMIRCSEFEID